MPTQIPEAVAEKIAQLSSGVEQLREGLLTRDAVEQMVAEAIAQERLTPVGNGPGYNPADYAPSTRALTGTFQERMAQIHTRDAAQLAPMLRVPEDTVREFQARADEVLVLETILSKGGRKTLNIRETNYYKQEFAPLVRAMDTQTAGEGEEWVPTGMSMELVRRVNLEMRVPGLFRMIPMPTQPYDLPSAGVVRRRSGSFTEQTADSGQTKIKKVTPGTGKRTLSAVALGVMALVSKHAEEDTIVPILPWIVDEIVEALAADWEDAILNGDSDGTHFDVDVVDADDPRQLIDGLRKYVQAGARTDVGATKLEVADLRANRRNMGKYGVDPSKLAHITSVSGYIDLLEDPSTITVDKLGPQATILSGQLATVDGAPIIVSEYVRTDLNATGVHDGLTETQTTTLTVHTGGFVQGERRGVTTEYLTELYSESDQDGVKATMRKAFEPLHDPTTEPVVAEAYNSNS